jgi:hypothetical protein
MLKFFYKKIDFYYEYQEESNKSNKSRKECLNNIITKKQRFC